jgi:hypothetical protein
MPLLSRCSYFDVAHGLSEDRRIAHTGGCSGAAALNIAYHLRPRRIALVGFDYDGSGCHWYEDDVSVTNSRDTWARWARYFDTTVAQMNRAGIEVVNLSPQSRIHAFRRLAIQS